VQRVQFLKGVLLALLVVVGLSAKAFCGESQEEQAARIEKLIDEATRFYFRGLKPPEAEWQKAEAAKKELVAMGQTAVPFLIERVRKGEGKVTGIFNAMAPTGVPELVDVLKTDEDPRVRLVAAGVIGGLRAAKDGARDEAVRALQDAVLNDPDARVREQALWSLENLRVKVDKDVLLKALGHKEANVRRAAVYQVHASLERTDAIEAMHAMMADKSAGVREAVGLTLCQYRDEAAIPLLIAVIADEDANSRKAQSALERWFRLRFYGDGPGQTKDRDEVKRKWREWWEDNKAQIGRASCRERVFGLVGVGVGGGGAGVGIAREAARGDHGGQPRHRTDEAD
jgi:hypothetical protein